MTRATVFVALVASSALVSGCGTVSRKTEADAAADTATDTGTDVNMANPDAGGDTGSNAGPDVAPDAARDVAPDVGGGGDTGRADAGSDAGTLTATWTTTAQPLRTQTGAYFTFSCPAGGAPASIWGTDAYTDDSSICTAAVHAGLVTLVGGGTVTIEILPGLATYAASSRNGITSLVFGAWSATFRFPAATTWTTNAVLYRGLNNTFLRYTCPSQGSTAQAIYGSDIYSDDSPVCVAAVHAGLITAAAGGSIQIEIVPGQSSYAATTRNGITSLAYGVWPGSYIFPP